MKAIFTTENDYDWIPLWVYVEKIGQHLIERKEKLDQQSRFDRFFPVCYFTSQLKEMFESDKGTYANTNERSLYVHTRLQEAICNRIKWKIWNNVKVQIDAYI